MHSNVIYLVQCPIPYNERCDFPEFCISAYVVLKQGLKEKKLAEANLEKVDKLKPIAEVCPFCTSVGL